MRSRAGGDPLAKLDFVVYRTTVHPNPNIPLFASNEPKPAILRAALVSAPTVETARGGRWHIGNITAVESDKVFYFRFGRLTRVSLQQTDDRGNFINLDLPHAPYTHGVADVEQELVALARNARLAPTPDALGRAFGRVLSSAVERRNVVIEAAPLKNPTEFISRLRAAFTVERLWLVNRRPNPFDVERDFVRPTSRVAEELRAQTVRTDWKGPSLDVARPEIEEIIQTTASTGGDAGATLRDTDRSTPTRVSLSSNLGTFSLEVDVTEVREAATAVLSCMWDLYAKIRHGR